MKRLIVIVGVMLMVAGMVSVARAGSSDTMTLTVSVTAALDVTIHATDYDFGSVALNSTTISTTSTAVKNSSTNAVETYQLKVSAGVSGWTIADSTGTKDNVRIQAIWNTAQPGSVPDDTAHNLDINGKTCDGTTNFVGNETHKGKSVDPGDEEKLWFKLWTPSSTTTEGQKKFYLTITASLG
jgi:hypothetical protein